MADSAWIKRENATTYISTLEKIKVIRKEQLIFPQKRRARYCISDPFFEFWFKFAKTNEYFLEVDIWDRVKEEFSAYFERVALEYLLEQMNTSNKITSTNPDNFGRWVKNNEVDIVFYSSTKSALFFGVKWKRQDYREAKEELSLLRSETFDEKFESANCWIIARSIENKEKIREEGYMAVELSDIVSGRSL